MLLLVIRLQVVFRCYVISAAAGRLSFISSNFFQFFSRVITRPMGRVKRLERNSRVGSGRVGSGRVGSGRVGSGRVASGRVRRCSNLTGRIGLGQEPFKYHGSGRIILTRSDPREVIRPVETPDFFPTLLPRGLSSKTWMQSSCLHPGGMLLLAPRRF